MTMLHYHCTELLLRPLVSTRMRDRLLPPHPEADSPIATRSTEDSTSEMPTVARLPARPTRESPG